MSKEETWRDPLRDALIVLALPPDEQIRVNGPGCLACDLIGDFELARNSALENAAGLSEEQRRLLDQIDAALDDMEEPDYECFNNEVVRRPVWRRLRELAAEALRAFDWTDARIEPFVEVQPGVWRRPPSKGPVTGR